MKNLHFTASENAGMQRGFLTAYQSSVNNFMSSMLGVGCDIDSTSFATIVLDLKTHTGVAYNDLQNYKNKISTNLLEVDPEDLKHWIKSFYNLICIQLLGSLHYCILSVVNRHPEYVDFTAKDVYNRVSRFVEHPTQMGNSVYGPIDMCELYILNRRFFRLLWNCSMLLVKRTDEDVIRIFRQRLEEYRVQNGTEQIKHVKRICNSVSENEKLTKGQFQQIYTIILNEIDDPVLRRIIDVHVENPVSLIKALRSKGYGEEVMEEVFCASIKLEELVRIFNQLEAPEPLNYQQKLQVFLAECVKDIQAGRFSKDGESLIRSSNEWFFVHRIFLEKDVKVLSLRKPFVEMLQSLPIKVSKLPSSPNNLNRIAQEFRERNYPNWEPVDGRSGGKHERCLELGGAALKAYEKHKKLLK